MTRSLILTAAITIAFCAGVRSDAQPTQPFSKEELGKIVEVLIDSDQLKQSSRIARVAVVPSEKGAMTSRRARISLVDTAASFEALLDLDSGDILSWDPVSTGRAPILSEEWARASAALKAHPDWQNAMAKRGYSSTEDIFCESLSAGYFPDAAAAKRRILKMPCYDISQAMTNIYGRPIEGLVATVDSATDEIIEILDEGIIPTPPPALQPPVITGAPHVSGPRDFSLYENHISFGPWDLTARLDDQFGLIIADAGFTHNDERRRVLAEGHVSEIFVPYMDPTESWAFRTYLDAGEFGLGTLTSPLLNGIDCSDSATYLVATTLSPLGKIIEKPNAICVFTRGMAGPLWRHYEALNGVHAGLAGRELVIRSIASIAHYDYVMDWVFRPQGDIEISIGATGIDAVKAVHAGAPADPHGQLVTPQLSAIYHDHFFSLRLDLDVDGVANRLVREHVREDLGRQNPLGRSYWYLEAETIMQEGPMHAKGAGVWRIEAAARRNATGSATAYQLMTEGTVSRLEADDFPQQRGAFSASPLWVSRHSVNERAAAGRYPNQSPGGAGLPDFADGENIDPADLVLWPTLGFRHITRPEDWPILSTVWKSVLLRPYGFFDANPTLSVGQ